VLALAARVWPFGLIGDDGPGSDLAKRTFTDRPNVQTTAPQDALVQNYDGVLRVAPPWPGD
jgi:hypothetical protein